MPYLIGVVLSVVVAAFARLVGFDRDRAFYPTVVIVVAAYYVLFVVSDSIHTVVIESIVMMLFAAAAVVGFRSRPWIVVVALASHGVFDAVHGRVVSNTGVPVWWPAFCASYDIAAACVLAWLMRRDRRTDVAQV